LSIEFNRSIPFALKMSNFNSFVLALPSYIIDQISESNDLGL